jgi:hypothetical protein
VVINEREVILEKENRFLRADLKRALERMVPVPGVRK